MDIVYVTYNSEKWIKPCFASWEKSKCAAEINIIVVDNASTDRTCDFLEEAKKELLNKGSVQSFEVVRLPENVGFGEANNVGFAQGASDLVCFFNIDTEIGNDTIEALQDYVTNAADDFGVWELRQTPYEHPKYYDPITLETSWCSGAAFAVKRDIYQSVGGFDKDFFMYAEDVDLSWKIREKNFKIMYCPKAVILHKSYAEAGEIKFVQYAYSMRNNILMRCRYGSRKDIWDGHLLFWKLLLSNGMGMKFNIQFAKVVKGYRRLRKKFRGDGKSEVSYFDGLNYSKMRYGAFSNNQKQDSTAKIQVYLIGEDKEGLDPAEQCVTNQTCLPERVVRVSKLEDVVAKLEQNEEKEECWISILQTKDRLFADHYEFLAGMILDSERREESKQIVGSVTQDGQVAEELSHYLLYSLFVCENRELFLSDAYSEIVSKCKKEAMIGEKQTVY